jgi:uncharacterized protein (DUF1800 family)
MQVHALHSPDIRARAKASGGPATSPGLGAFLLGRAAFGPTPEALDEFQGFGTTDQERLEAWVDRHLDPESIDDSDLDARLAEGGFETLSKSRTQLWTDHWMEDEDWEVRMRPIMEMEVVVYLRAVHSRRQLVEVLADFWHNHFNVWGWHDDVGPVFVHYDRDVIRANLLGSFRQMLEEMTASTAMLFYLDNVFNASDGPNENFAREVLELHTLGEDNYLGAIPADQVPVGDDGVPVAFVDEDLRELARCLTGWTLHPDTGEFLFYDDFHDWGSKRVLGLDIPAGQDGIKDVRDVFDLLAGHRGVALFIAEKLCRRLVSDEPPQSLVDRAADVFQNHRESPDQLARVVRTILVSDEFRQSWGAKSRRPLEMVVGALRATGGDLRLPFGDDFSNSFVWLNYETGHLPFNWIPPTGFPDLMRAWLSTTPLVKSWAILNILVDWVNDDGYRPIDVVGTTPPELESSEEMVDYWTERILGRPVDGATRTEIVAFMAQGRLPSVPLNRQDEWVQDRMRALVGLILVSPDFLWR